MVTVMPLKSHKFRGNVWWFYGFKDHDDLGACDPVEAKHRGMDIPLGGKSQLDLDTVIHESLHACLRDVNEEAVNETATDIARLLWRLGWRKKS